MSAFSLGDLVWVRLGEGDHEEPATIIDVDCLTEDNKRGLKCKLRVSLYEAIFDFDYVRHFETGLRRLRRREDCINNSLAAARNIRRRKRRNPMEREDCIDNSLAAARSIRRRKRQKTMKHTEDLPRSKRQNYEFHNAHIAKYFGMKLFQGRVVAYEEILHANGRQRVPLWKIQYDDGDTEEMERKELNQAMKLFFTNQKKKREHEKHIMSHANRSKTIDAKKKDSKKGKKKKSKVPPPKQQVSKSQREKQKQTENDPSELTSFPYQNAKVGKYFDKTLYFGIVTGCFVFDNDMKKKQQQQLQQWLWHISFDDGDQEDWDLQELSIGLSLYEKALVNKEQTNQKDKTITEDSTAEAANEEQPIETDHGRFYQVDEILDRRFKKMKGDGVEIVQYLVSWKNTALEHQWLNSEQLDPNSLAEAFRNFPPTTGINDNEEDNGAVISVEEYTTNNYSDTTNATTTVASVDVDDTTAKRRDYEVREENFESDDEDYSHDEETTALRNEVDHIAKSKYNRTGSAEVVIKRKTYRIGMSFYTNDLSILTIDDLIPEKQMAECTCFVPSKRSFFDQPNDQLPEGTYVQLGSKKTVPFTDLKRACKSTIPKADWIYDFDPLQKHSKFCYYKNTGKLPVNVAGKSRPTVLELFAGAGGMSLGFANAGMETKWIVECNEFAAATFKANHPRNVQVYTEDIRSFLAGARAGNLAYPKPGEVDHIHGSPPCQGFSRANRVGGEEAEANNNLTFEFINAIRHYQPSTATYENVPGILMERNRPYFQAVVSQLLSLGYQVRAEILNASDYGDPQNRRRVFLWAAKCHMILPSTPPRTHSDNGNGLLFPRKTVKDAIGCLEDLTTEKKSLCYPNGDGIVDHNCRTIGWVVNNETHVLRADLPSRTIVGCPSRLRHYSGNRLLTIREIACLQSFPWDYHFFGTFLEQFKQVANAVPVMLATHVARAVAKAYGLP